MLDFLEALATIGGWLADGLNAIASLFEAADALSPSEKKPDDEAPPAA